MIKCPDHLAFRVPPNVKDEYEALDDATKKRLKRKVLDDICRFLWMVHHYDNQARAHYGLDPLDAGEDL